MPGDLSLIPQSSHKGGTKEPTPYVVLWPQAGHSIHTPVPTPTPPNINSILQMKKNRNVRLRDLRQLVQGHSDKWGFLCNKYSYFLLFLFCFGVVVYFDFETRSHSELEHPKWQWVASNLLWVEDILVLLVLLPLPPKCWNGRSMSSPLAYRVWIPPHVLLFLPV